MILRTPLHAIKTAATSVTSDEVSWSPEEIREVSMAIDSETGRLTALVDKSAPAPGLLLLSGEAAVSAHVGSVAAPRETQHSGDARFARDCGRPCRSDQRAWMSSSARVSQTRITRPGFRATRVRARMTTITAAGRKAVFAAVTIARRRRRGRRVQRVTR
jgi:hypothetical protein